MNAIPAILVLGPGGSAVAERIRAALAPAEIHGFSPRLPEAAIGFAATAAHVAGLFAAGRPVIGICAAGILIRAVAPLLADKSAEPPVIAVAEDGSSVVPLLGGHHGANDLARRIAAALGSHAAVTTAGDLRLGLALDEPPQGWRLQDPAQVKAVAAALLAGEKVQVVNETAADAAWLAALPQAADGTRRILISTRADAAADLVYHPQTLVLGIGCERLAEAAEVADLTRRCLKDANLAPQSVAAIASIALKAAEPAIHDLAAALGVPARFFSAAELEAERPRLRNPSEVVFQETGCHGVAEGAALAAVGAAGDLRVGKTRSQRATCAIAEGPGPIDASGLGRPRGVLDIVGIGPGSAAGRTREVDAALGRATDLVGYSLYLDLLGDLAVGKRRHGYELGAEEARVRIALDLAAEGRQVALVCSGDAGIYAMATLVYELIDREDRPDWARLAITGLPGVSAMQVAAARIGAPLGHDFCAISLSDLLTPWAAIEKRLLAAAEGDFVVAFYNPVSRRRRTQLAAAKRILLARRPAETPVVLARNLGRDGETVRATTLAALDIEAVDMLTLVIVGSSETRCVARPDGGQWVYTPRGYGQKMDMEKAS